MTFTNRKTKTRAIVAGCFAFLFFNIHAQMNLVPNGTFEDTVQCPWTGGQITLAKYWSDPTNGSGTSPDYYNACSPIGWGLSIPYCGIGYQYARYGNAMVGIYNFQGNFSEYIQSNLIDTLEPNKSYCVVFHLNLANKCQISCSSLGAYLSSTPISRADSAVLHYNPQVSNPIGNFILDTLNWIKISGIYTATGNEKFVTIGNFHNVQDTISTGFGIVSGSSYFYIDDVSVVEVSPANAGNDTTYCTLDTAIIGGPATFAADYVWSVISGNAQIDSVNKANPKVWATSSGSSTFVMQKTQCSVVTYDTVSVSFNCVGMDEEKMKAGVKVFPNPADNMLFISIKESEKLQFVLFDAIGKQVMNKNVNVQSGMGVLDLKGVSVGIYFYRLMNGDVILKQERLIISK